MKAVRSVPARMASSRYPGKPVAPILGMALIEHVRHPCRLAWPPEPSDHPAPGSPSKLETLSDRSDQLGPAHPMLERLA